MAEQNPPNREQPGDPEEALRAVDSFLSDRGYPYEADEVEDGLVIFQASLIEAEEEGVDFIILVDFHADPPAGKVILPLDEECSEELDRQLLLDNLELENACFGRNRDPEGYVAASSFLLSELSAEQLESSLDGTLSAAAHFFDNYYEE